MHYFVALLRGINVGGHNIIKMTDLKAYFESMGFQNVQTYIQSGNVIFATPASTSTQALSKKIEAQLEVVLKVPIVVVVASLDDLKKIVTAAPANFGQRPDYKYNVVFLRPPATPTDVLTTIQPKEGVDKAAAGPGVVYFSTLLSAATRSALPKLVGTPAYKQATLRNYNTTIKLLQLLTTAATTHN